MSNLVPALGSATPPALKAEARIEGIRGLRALAVLSVTLYHVSAMWLPGGFVGVDVFFVISGFVVAHSVYGREQPDFRSYFIWFYRRRFLRILPAIFLYVFVMELVGIFFIPAFNASKYIDLTGAAALFGASNVVLLTTSGGYFAAASEFNSFTHTWSLAVEEQYYFLFPLFSYLIILNTGRWPKQGRLALGLVWLGCAASLILCAATTVLWRDFAFYMLPTRFWELGLGFLLRVHGDRWQGRLDDHRTRVSLIGLAAFAALGASFWITGSERFPFPGAVLPCAATVILIGCIWLVPGNPADRLLQLRPLSVIGDISYSLYLWHWAVIVMMRWTVGLDTVDKHVTALLLMAVLAVLSYHTVEKPLRYDPRLASLGTARFFLTYSAIGLVLAGACAAFAIAKPRLGLAVSNDAEIWSPYIWRPDAPGACPVAVATTKIASGLRIDFQPECKHGGRALFVVGDSHAGAYGRMVHMVSAGERMAAHLFTKSGCRLVSMDEAPVAPACVTFRDTVAEQVDALGKPGDVVFFTGLYTPRYRDEWGKAVTSNQAVDRRPLAASERAIAVATDAVRRLQARGLTVVVEAPKPTIPTALFRCADWFNRMNEYCARGWSVPLSEMKRRRARPLAALREIVHRAPGTRLWDPLPLLCEDRRCDGYQAGKPLYFDTDHLSGFGNEVLFPDFVSVLRSAGPGAPVNNGVKASKW